MNKFAFLLMLGACGCSVTQTSLLTLPTVPYALRVPAGQTLARTYLGRGTQNYVCQAKDGGYAWSFLAPEAELFDARNVKAATHSGGPSWQAPDGSAVVGAVQAMSPSPGSIPWLLLSAKSRVGSGLFGETTYVQRLATTGGLAPTTGCGAAAAGREVNVAYTALYAFYEAGAEQSNQTDQY